MPPPDPARHILATIDQIVPWQELCAIIEPYYPKAGKGRPPVELKRMLRMSFVQHWFNLADESCEEALLDSMALRRFVGIDLGHERVPDGTTLLKFRRLLKQHALGKHLFATVGQLLQARGLKAGTGTIVDAPLIGAPGSTKNATRSFVALGLANIDLARRRLMACVRSKWAAGAPKWPNGADEHEHRGYAVHRLHHVQHRAVTRGQALKMRGCSALP